MTDKIGSMLAQTLGALQLRRTTATGRTSTRQQAEDPTPSSGAELGFDQRVRQRIVAIDPEDPRRRQKAFQAYIELRLLKEFGENLNGDAQFHQVVDDVVHAMESVPELKSDIDQAVDRLLSTAR